MKPLNISIDNFTEEVINSQRPVLVDFWASWCGPCKMLAPVIDEITNEKDDFKFVKINVDKEEELAMKYDIKSIPTLVIIKNGTEVDRISGFMPKTNILQFLGEA